MFCSILCCTSTKKPGQRRVQVESNPEGTLQLHTHRNNYTTSTRTTATGLFQARVQRKGMIKYLARTAISIAVIVTSSEPARKRKYQDDGLDSSRTSLPGAVYLSYVTLAISKKKKNKKGGAGLHLKCHSLKIGLRITDEVPGWCTIPILTSRIHPDSDKFGASKLQVRPGQAIQPYQKQKSNPIEVCVTEPFNWARESNVVAHVKKVLPTNLNGVYDTWPVFFQ
ncbi:hypothetical protein B0H16DRAFT_1473285 [Mycena metata]|uniref:Uncharacterized protein n=1 Tax=Mycena metata TaxID=1033252 RepID=A0AAD7HK83_9AGAR|nr:hypothetical protein B0H16DRAFT_1473285 [Mycena metata]